MRMLLLGQAESGKSTMLKNFQLHFAPKAFHTEVELWRPVIQLNLVRSVNVILNVLSSIHDTPVDAASRRASTRPLSPDGHRLLRMRLAPIRQVELSLNKALSAVPVEQPPASAGPATLLDGPYGPLDVCVRSGSEWKTRVQEQMLFPGRGAARGELVNAARILEACREDIIALWEDSSVQATLRTHGVQLQNQPGFFLDQAARVAAHDYTPTEEDILKARIRTTGVEEYRVEMETATEKGEAWTLYDVGGHRGQRAAWAPYFDDVNAIVFLCPIAGFDQVLSEDKSVNRLRDSMKLWKTICKSKALANAKFILLLNKCDILKAKLDSGVKFSDYVTVYEGGNTFEDVTSYLKRSFQIIHKEYSPRKRELHVHFTCAIDTSMMSVVLTSIREFIVMDTLKELTLV
ncbi:heterotrimeric G-protein alpha subunit-like protein [Gelatoporia subvermispora B]|uniref:Heterotrimeric G-protein alpha subunit-like protein n=1 Tax=Ceriporiopsis subvermispora (strain B) TaxID=914234 RepID=M2PCX2_CERS8|nr:heterotrimeric G-protein alpha subunit-like protein [Gelatoporia subvermispora B]